MPAPQITSKLKLRLKNKILAKQNETIEKIEKTNTLEKKEKVEAPPKPSLPSDTIVIDDPTISILKIGVDSELIFDKFGNLKYIIVNSSSYRNELNGRKTYSVPIPDDIKLLKKQNIKFISTTEIGSIIAIETSKLYSDKYCNVDPSTESSTDPSIEQLPITDTVSFIIFERIGIDDNFDIRVIERLKYHNVHIKMNQVLDVIFSNINNFWIVIKQDSNFNLVYYFNSSEVINNDTIMSEPLMSGSYSDSSDSNSYSDSDSERDRDPLIIDYNSNIVENTEKKVIEYSYNDIIINSFNNIINDYNYICSMWTIYDINPSVIYVLVHDKDYKVLILEYTIGMYNYCGIFKPMIELNSINTMLYDSGKYISYCANYNISTFSVLLELPNDEKCFYTGIMELTNPDANMITKIKLKFSQNTTFPKKVSNPEAQIMIYTIMKKTEASIKKEEYQLRKVKIEENKKYMALKESRLKEKEAINIATQLLKEEELELTKAKNKKQKEKKRVDTKLLEEEKLLLLEKEKLEKEKLEKEALEKEELLEKERLDKEALLETERLEKQLLLEKEKLEAEKLVAEKLVKVRLKKDRFLKVKRERAILLKEESLEREKLATELLLKERFEKEILLKKVEVLEKEKLEQEQLQILLPQPLAIEIQQQLPLLPSPILQQVMPYYSSKSLVLNQTEYTIFYQFIYYMTMYNPILAQEITYAQTGHQYSLLLFNNRSCVMNILDILVMKHSHVLYLKNIMHPEIENKDNHSHQQLQKEGFTISAIYGSFLPIIYSLLLNEIGYMFNAFGTNISPLSKLKDYDTLVLKLLDDYIETDTDYEFIREQSFIIGYQGYQTNQSSDNECQNTDKPITRTKIQASSIHILLCKCWDLNHTSAILLYEQNKSPYIIRHPDFTDFLFGEHKTIQLLSGKTNYNLYDYKITEKRLEKAIATWYN